MKPHPFDYDKKEFLNNLQIKIEQHLSDPKLNVKGILRLVGMSRTNLHMKLKDSIGMSTTEYIRYIRLNKARQLLLQHPEWTIYQIALEVGFNSHSYFTRKFKEVFGCCPQEMRDEFLV